MMAIDLRVRQITLVVFIEKAEATVVDANHHLFAKVRLLRIDRLPQPASQKHPHQHELAHNVQNKTASALKFSHW